jgi:hypothetical protein
MCLGIGQYLWDLMILSHDPTAFILLTKKGRGEEEQDQRRKGGKKTAPPKKQQFDDDALKTPLVKLVDQCFIAISKHCQSVRSPSSFYYFVFFLVPS